MLSMKAKNVKPSTTLAITARGKALKAQGVDIVTFTAGEPDFDTPDYIKEGAKKGIDDNFTRYTKASGIDELRQGIAEKLRENNTSYSADEIVVSNGGKQALINAFMAILDDGDEVIIPAPFWLSYTEMVKINNGVPVVVQTSKDNGYKLTKELLEKNTTDKTKAILINSPSNPTGAIYSLEELEVIADFAKEKDLMVISDEIYEYLVYDGEKHISIASLPDMKERTIIVNGFSKAYAMTGWRLGYTAAPLPISKAISAFQSHMTSNPCSISQMAGLAAITGGKEAIDKMVVAFDERRKFLYNEINSLDCLSAVEPKGAFYLFVDTEELNGKTHNGNKITCAADIAEILVNDYNVTVIPCQDFGAPNSIRLSYAISMDMIKKGTQRIKEFVANCK